VFTWQFAMPRPSEKAAWQLSSSPVRSAPSSNGTIS
jgi:hypothetical protein